MDKNKKNIILNFDEESKNLISYATSKGNLPKWHIKNNWYKTDALGYENFSECLISDLLKYSNIYEYVKYSMTQGIYNSELKNFSVSKNFLHGYEMLMTFYRIYFLTEGKEISKAIIAYENVEDRIKLVVEHIEKYSGIKNIGKIITSILELDMFFLNEDRHFNNIALIRNSNTKSFRVAPVFDNGLSLLSDLNEYKIENDIYKNIDSVKAKPFSNSLEEQCETAEKLYGTVLNFKFDKKDVDRELKKYEEYYDLNIIERVRTIMFEQMRKYQYLFRN